MACSFVTTASGATKVFRMCRKKDICREDFFPIGLVASEGANWARITEALANHSYRRISAGRLFQGLVFAGSAAFLQREDIFRGQSHRPMLKVELHAHTSDDPIDQIPYSAKELIDRAASLGYDALAITLHNRQHPIERLVPYAAERGIVLLPGIERTIQGRHVLLINYRRETEEVETFEDLARLRRSGPGLVIAPHPFFPASTCLGSDLDRHRDLFDAVEINAMFTSSLNFNRRAERWAARHGRPLVGNGDIHRLRQLGTTYSLVDAERDPGAICHAIREGRVRVESRPLSWIGATSILASMMVGQVWRRPVRGTQLPRPSVDPSSAT